MAAYTTIDDPSAYFKVQLWTGNGSTQAITFDDTDTDMSPNLVWIKERTVNNHELYDSVRGATARIYPDMADDEDTNSTGLTAFGADGFTLGGAGGTNNNTDTYVGWCWNESVTSGFDIVIYTGTGSARTVSHSLSATPHMIIIKRRDASGTWHVYHKTLGADFVAGEIDTTAAKKDNANFMNDTEPTSSVFTVNTYDEVNASSGTHVAYCFAPKQGFSKFGYYVGNGNADGPFVYTGFRPAYVLIKRTDTTGDWYIFDNKLIPRNIITQYLTSNKNEAVKDAVAAYYIDFLSNGFKLRGTGSETNASGGSYIYAAFAEAPFVNSNGVPCNAR